jgi:transcriptional regulator with XRE-family HTH domain
MLRSHSKSGLQVVKLRVWREQNSFTQQQVADEVNRLIRADGEADAATISQGSVDRWEKGTIPRQENIRRLTRFTRGSVTFADFYSGEEPPPRKPRALSVAVAAARKAAAVRHRRRAVSS